MYSIRYTVYRFDNKEKKKFQVNSNHFSNFILLYIYLYMSSRGYYARHVRSSTFPRNWVQINVIHPFLHPPRTLDSDTGGEF